MGIRMTITPEQRLEKAVVTVMRTPGLEFLCGLVMIGKRSICHATRTAKTDGVNSWYSPAFMEELSDPQLRGLIVHEEFHKMFRHTVTWKHLWKKNPAITNQACDYVINLPINDFCKSTNGTVTLPPNPLLDERFRDMTVKQVFDILLQERESDPDKSQGLGEPMDEHDWEAANAMPAEEQKALAKQIEEAVRQGKMMADKLGNSQLTDNLDELLQPKVDWREALREFVERHTRGNDMSTFRRPRRRYIASGIYMPDTYNERVDEVMFADDVSGSTIQFRKEFRSELAGVLDKVKPARTHYLEWDTSVSAHTVIDHGSEADVIKLPVRGGGGTNVTCVSDYLKEHNLHPKVVVVMTDGYLSGGWGYWPSGTHVLWCIYDNPHAVPDIGSAIHISP